MSNDINWNLIFTAIASIAILLTAIVIVIQVWLQRKNNQLQTRNYQLEAFMKVLEELNSQDSRYARNFISRIPIDDMEKYKRMHPELIEEEIYENMQKVWTSFEHVGYIVKEKLVEEKYVIEMFWGAIIRSWEKLKPIIKNVRISRKNEISFQYFQQLYRKSKNFEYWLKK